MGVLAGSLWLPQLCGSCWLGWLSKVTTPRKLSALLLFYNLFSFSVVRMCPSTVHIFALFFSCDSVLVQSSRLSELILLPLG